MVKNNIWLSCELENIYDIIDEYQLGGNTTKVPAYLKPISPFKKLVLKTMYKISPERTKKYLKIKIKTPLESKETNKIKREYISTTRPYKPR